MSKINSLIKDFSTAHLIAFLRSSIPSFKPNDEELDHLFPENIYDKYESIAKIGEAEIDKDDLIVIASKTQEPLTERTGKKNQYEIAKTILKHEVKDASLFVFYDDEGNFRFSFVKANYLGTKRDFTDFKRYTYFVHPQKQNKTFKRQIGNCDFSSLDAIEKAFSVETLSKEFYTQLSYWYFASLNEVKFPTQTGENQHQVNSKAMIRLITRMMFVWFMKQKKLIPNAIFDKNQLDECLNHTDATGSTYYKAILQNLFFATLNTEMGEKRKWITTSGYGVQHFYRYKRYFKEEKADSFIDLMRKIPFLNGGLFENLDVVQTADKEKGIPKEETRIDCFSDNPKNEDLLKVPDYLFFGTRQADISAFLDDNRKNNIEIEGLIDILNRFDFTIDENSPNDQEVALDPELLGTVFENLLASYNPETQTTARKESGSFYTPRPIVNYMVKESLFYHLQEKSKLPEEKLRQLFDANTAEHLKENERQTLVEALTYIKILDPACGSGAFPMGALQQMVHLLNVLDPENQIFKDKLQRKLKAELQQTIDHSNFEELKTNIEEVFKNRRNDPDYARKLFLIQNCLFGVDIQSIAMQISKLRFFISLLVEQQIDENAENLGVKPLPNLETKFVAANTLIGLKGVTEVGQQLKFKDPKLEKLEEELTQVREKYFNARTYATKHKYRIQDKGLREKIAELLIDDGWANDTAQQIAHWDPFDQNASSDWFDPEWMFGVQKFDIVIGNPPYVSAVSMARDINTKKYFKKVYPEATGSYDIYVLFLLRIFNDISENGIYCWIIPNKFLVADYATNTKNKLIANGLNYSIDVSNFNVFQNASVYPIVIFGNKQNNKDFKTLLLEKYEDLEKRIFTVPEKLQEHKSIKDFGIKVRSGATGFEAQKLKCFLSEVPNANSIPFIVSGGIDRYTYSNENIRFMGLKLDKAFITNDIGIAESKWSFWSKPKIVVAGMTKVIEAVYCKDALGLGVGSYGIYDFNGFNPFYITAVLNSKYLSYYINVKFKDKHLAGGYLAINKSTIEKLPFIKPNDKIFNQIVNLSKELHLMHFEDDKYMQLDYKVDILVYKAFELRYDEIKKFDPEFNLTQQEYDNYEV